MTHTTNERPYPKAISARPDTGRVVVMRTTVTVETRTSTNRVFYEGMTEKQILEYEGTQEVNAMLEDFVRDVESTPASELIITRTVDIVDKE